MYLHLIRHADAEDRADDAARELSATGRRQVREMAEYLAARGIFSPREIWHSPLLRAQETAALLKSHGKLGAKLVQTPGLTPEDSAQRIARQLRASPVESLALVGHEPHLSSLASLLVAGGPGAAHFRFAKCAVLALEGGADFWVVNWLLAPDLVAKP